LLTISDARSSKRWLPRFGLRALLFVVFVTAVGLFGGRAIYQWWTAVATVPLSQAVDLFNIQANQNEVGVLEPPLTEDEVVAAIQVQLPTLNAWPHVTPIFEQIATTRQLPADARLYFFAAWEPKNSPRKIVWWINLDVVTRKGSGFALRIRENNSPAYGQNFLQRSR
jgi:hypothetical protein